MSDVYTGIDLGTDSIKIIVCEKFHDQYHVLATHCASSAGIKDGFVVDMKSCVNSVKNAVKNANDLLGIAINKVVCCVPPKDCKMDIVSGSCSVVDYNEITGLDVSNVLLDALKKVNLTNDELVTAMPIHFTIDDDVVVHDPKGMHGSVLNAKVVVSTTPKEPLYRILEVLKLSGLETVDICYSSFGDYYSLADKKYDELVGAIINIGEESTNVSVFNRGIQIKNGVLPVGSKNVDKDLMYAFKAKLSDCRELKEKFAISVSSLASEDDIWDLTVDNNEVKKVSQLSVSKVVEARVREILKLAKNEIKNLTNREIRYIMITGGLSELAGFSTLVEQEFGFVAKVGNIPIIGIRHNKFSSCFGIIKFFNDKLELRGKDYNMFTKEELESIMLSSRDMSGNNLTSKMFDHYFDD